MMDGHGLESSEAQQGLETLLASVPRGFDAPEGQLDATAGSVIVDEHLATADAPRHAQLTGSVTRPDPGHQAKVGRIGQCHRMVFVIKGQGREHRTKDFFLRQPVIDRHIAQQHGRLVVPSRGCLGNHLALCDRFNAIGPGPMDTPFFYPAEGPEAVAYHKTAAALSPFTPTGLTHIEDIVPWIRFLVSDGWWMTGQTILVNGGYTTK